MVYVDLSDAFSINEAYRHYNEKFFGLFRSVNKDVLGQKNHLDEYYERFGLGALLSRLKEVDTQLEKALNGKYKELFPNKNVSEIKYEFCKSLAVRVLSEEKVILVTKLNKIGV